MAQRFTELYTGKELFGFCIVENQGTLEIKQDYPLLDIFKHIVLEIIQDIHYRIPARQIRTNREPAIKMNRIFKCDVNKLVQQEIQHDKKRHRNDQSLIAFSEYNGGAQESIEQEPH